MHSGRMINETTHKWQTWATSSHANNTYQQWISTEPDIYPWRIDQLGQPAFQAHPSLNIDQMQACLVRLAQSGCGYAGMALACQLEPGLRKIARTTAFGYSEPASEVMSAFFEVLFSHNLTKRPNKIAANLLLDTRQKIFRAGKRDMIHFQAADALRSYDFRTHDKLEIDTTLWIGEVVSKALASYAKPKERRLIKHLIFQHWILERPLVEVSQELNLSKSAATTKLWRFRNLLKTLEANNLN